MIKPYTERTPDTQYRDLLKFILDNGVRVKSQQGVDALTVIGPKPLHFKLENGFPMITERSIKGFWKGSIGEICAFINGAHTLEALESFGCKFWTPWGTPEKTAKRGLEVGDLGPGSYGAAFHDFPTQDGGTYNQVKNIVEQMIEFPHLRTHFISPWIPQHIIRGTGKQQKVVVAPCHGWIHLRIIDNKLTLHMIQRSADVPVGVPSNMVQYAALLMMLAHVTKTEPYEFVHSFSDAHIYVDQIPNVEELLKREPKALPTVTMINKKDDIFAYRAEDFEVSDYDPHPGMKDIPVAV
ncbi:thymidylate synthase [Candidatus Parcubacteria bacterium]|nr:thymidylate synthase [Candidatus Parcubacteria bacterium]